MEQESDFAPDGIAHVDISIELMRLPDGHCPFEQVVREIP
jgi:hypothetical protein